MLEIATVSAFIATLSITGTLPDNTTKTVAIGDFSTMQDEVTPRLCPYFAPDLNAPISLQTLTRDTFGTRATAKQTIAYVMPYSFFYMPHGGERRLSTVLPQMLLTLKAIVTAIENNDKPSDPVVDLYVANLSTLGAPIVDASGNSFHGASLTLTVVEFIN
jgi:hypothetical protein